MKALNVFLAVAVSVLIGLLVFEGGLRLIGKGPPARLTEFDPVVGWRKVPGKTVRRRTPEFDVTYELNGFGLRDDADQTQAKPADTFRVLCLGDSFTMGYAVDREDLFVDQIEHWWQLEGRKVEVVNAGTEAYSTDQAVAWLEEHGPAWSPDLVLVFGYDNDLYYHAGTNYLRFPKPRYSAEGTRETTTLADPGSGGLQGNTAIGRLLLPGAKPDRLELGDGKSIQAEFAPLLTAPPAILPEIEARTVGVMRALERTSRELGAEVAFVPIPAHSAVDDSYREVFGDKVLKLSSADWDPNRPIEIFLAAARTAGVRTLDPREALRAAGREAGPLYNTTDFHLNPAGNRALADYLHTELDTLALLPGATTTVDKATAIPDIPRASKGLPRFLPWFLGLWAVLGTLFATYCRKDEQPLMGFLKVGGLLLLVFTIAIGGTRLIGLLPPQHSGLVLGLVILAILGFVLFKLGDRIGTILELLKAFMLRGHWYLMPLVAVLLSVGSLLVVAASSPLVAPFIYTLF